jgi:teichuronic acid biosynthesis glycosyltransferase TuaC
MRILAVTNMYPSADFPGRGVFVHEQINGLTAVGLDMHVLFIDRIREGPSAYFRMAERISKAFKEFNPDLVHVMYGGVMAERVVRRFHRRPVVVTFHGSDLLGESLSGWARKWISRYGIWCSKRAAIAADGIVVVARHLLKALPRTMLAEKVRVLPCGIDLERFKPMDMYACRCELGWQKDSFHVVFASSNGDLVKRPWLAKAAVEEAQRLGVPAKLHYMTGVPNSAVPLWLNAGDSLLLTSLHEGSPTVVKEALACGLPVVSVDVGDVAERIEAIEGCYLAQAEPADLACKLSLVHQRRQRLECSSRLLHISVLNVARQLQSLYEILTTQGRSAHFSPLTEDFGRACQESLR